MERDYEVQVDREKELQKQFATLRAALDDL